MHKVTNGYCEYCNAQESSPGLEYTQNSDGTYTVIGMGTCTDDNIIIGIYNNRDVTSIGDLAFYNRTNIKSVIILDSVVKIGRWAFEDCTSLKSVTIGRGIKDIGDAAFRNCFITDVYISDIVGWCSLEFDFLLWESNPLWYGANLYLNGELVTKLVIPDGVTSIGTQVFGGCNSIKSIVIPDSVIAISSYAFASDSIESVIFENPANWRCIDLYNGDVVEFSRSDLADEENAAECLTSTHYSKYWYRK